MSGRTPWDAILFDLDGTLLDSVPLILDSFRHAFASLDLEPPAAGRLLLGVGIPLRQHFRRYVSDPEVVERLIETYRDYNLAHHDERVSAFPGVKPMLEDLRAAEVPVAIVTSKNRVTTERGLALTGLSALVDGIVSSDDVENPKPHPEPVERALAMLRATAPRTAFVGDSLHDLAAGRAAGVRTAAALWGPFTQADLATGAPDYWLTAPEQLATSLRLSA